MTPKVAIAGLLLLTIFLVGCKPPEKDPSAEYQAGYAAGMEAGKKSGFDDGYTTGFEKARPGTDNKLSPITRTIYKILIWGGALKIILSLALIILALILTETSSPLQIAGKVIFGILGSILTILLAAYFGIAGDMEAVLLSPAPSSFLGELLLASAAAAITYLLFRFLPLILQDRSRFFEAWAIFVLAAIITLLIPVLIAIWENVTDISKYAAGCILSGALFGGLYVLGRELLSDESPPTREKGREKGDGGS